MVTLSSPPGQKWLSYQVFPSSVSHVGMFPVMITKGSWSCLFAFAVNLLLINSLVGIISLHIAFCKKKKKERKLRVEELMLSVCHVKCSVSLRTGWAPALSLSQAESVPLHSHCWEGRSLHIMVRRGWGPNWRTCPSRSISPLCSSPSRQDLMSCPLLSPPWSLKT